MRKYLLHVLIISFVLILAPTAQVATYAGWQEDMEEDVRNNPDDASAHCKLAFNYLASGQTKKAIKIFKLAIRLDPYNTIEAESQPEHTVKELSFYGLGTTFLWARKGNKFDIVGVNAAKIEYKKLKKLDTKLANILYDEISEAEAKYEDEYGKYIPPKY